MKKYVFLFKGGMPKPEEAKEHMMKWGPWIGNLAHGEQRLGDPFQPTGKIVSGSMGDQVADITMDNNMVSGYFVVEAENYDGAVALTKGCPIFENSGSVEVREIMPMDMSM